MATGPGDPAPAPAPASERAIKTIQALVQTQKLLNDDPVLTDDQIDAFVARLKMSVDGKGKVSIRMPKDFQDRVLSFVELHLFPRSRLHLHPRSFIITSIKKARRRGRFIRLCIAVTQLPIGAIPERVWSGISVADVCDVPPTAAAMAMPSRNASTEEEALDAQDINGAGIVAPTDAIDATDATAAAVDADATTDATVTVPGNLINTVSSGALIPVTWNPVSNVFDFNTYQRIVRWDGESMRILCREDASAIIDANDTVGVVEIVGNQITKKTGVRVDHIGYIDVEETNVRYVLLM